MLILPYFFTYKVLRLFLTAVDNTISYCYNNTFNFLSFQDPEEFLNGLVAQLLRAEPFLKLSSGQEAYCYQLFVEKDEHVSLPTVQQLLEQSFTTSGVKLSEVGLQ